MEDAAFWPAWPRCLLFAGVVLAAFALAWSFWLRLGHEDLQRARAQETALKREYSEKLLQAVNLDALKQRKAQVEQSVAVLEKQLPSKAEMDALLSDINQSGLGRSLQFDLFKPGAMIQRDYYAELPITLVVTGRYHDIGAFVADIAGLSRIVTLGDISLAPSGKDTPHADALVLRATARTYRYLDDAGPAASKTSKLKATQE